MATPDDLHRRLWRLAAELDETLAADSLAAARRLVELLRAEGWALGPEASRELEQYYQGVETALRAGIAGAVALGSATPMADELVARLAREAFERTWEDGRNLSSRLWQFRSGTTAGMGRVLSDGLRTGRSISGLIYDLQRQIEAAGTPFDIRQQAWDDWATMLAEAGAGAIRNPKMRDTWKSTARQVRDYIKTLKETGTRQAAQTAYKRIVEAVNAGQEQLLSDAIVWWMYDKQLYFLKRIARTELATAQHRAVIASTEEDPDIIGYHWRLSSTHPEPDICDYYAGIDMGLGKGVWTKEAVPKQKAHPHCMCLLVPRVTPRKNRGDLTYADFLRNATPALRNKILPKWAQQAIADGTPLEALIRPDGLDLLTKAQAGIV